MRITVVTVSRGGVVTCQQQNHQHAVNVNRKVVLDVIREELNWPNARFHVTGPSIEVGQRQNMLSDMDVVVAIEGGTT